MGSTPFIREAKPDTVQLIVRRRASETDCQDGDALHTEGMSIDIASRISVAKSADAYTNQAIVEVIQWQRPASRALKLVP
jgi:hypothetical protein